MAKGSQGSSHHLKVVGFRLWQRKDLIYEISAINPRANKNPRFCFLFNDSLNRVKTHMKQRTKISIHHSLSHSLYIRLNTIGLFFFKYSF